jgi:hypothetical protein
MTAVASPDHDNTLEETRQRNHRDEVQFYWRMTRCFVLLAIFCISVLVLKEHHEDAFVMVALTLLGLWLLYTICYICCHLCCCCCGSTTISPQRQRPSAADITTGLMTTTTIDFHHDEDYEDEEDCSTTFLAYDIDETPTKIRECQQEITVSASPTNGTYNVVFSAIYFGKALRTEGQLELQFEKEENRGWNLKGWSIFKDQQKAEIQEGFVNAKGQLYWISTAKTIYRGVLDFQSNTLFDGEFLSESGSPHGRIVRLELSHVAIDPLMKLYNVKLSTTTTTLEMSQLSSNRNSKTEDDDQPLILV